MRWPLVIKLVAGLSPLVAVGLLGAAHALTTSLIGLFLSLGTVLLIAFFGGALNITLLAQKPDRNFKWFVCLALDFCIAAYCAIHILSAILIFVGFSV
jgi:hypothetical protein